MTQNLKREIKELKEENVRLKESRNRLQATLNTIDYAIISTDTEGHIITMNPVANELTGWQRHEAQGEPIQKVFKIINSKTKEPISNPISQVLEKGEAVNFSNHTILISRDKHEYHIIDSASPIRDETGKIIGSVLIFKNMSQFYKTQKSLKKSEDFVKSIFDIVREGIFSVDKNLNTQYINSYIKNLHPDKSDFVGKKCYKSFYSRETPCDPCPVLACMDSGKTEKAILPAGPDADNQRVEAFSSPVKDPETEEIVKVIIFIHSTKETARKRQSLEKSCITYKSLFEQSNDSVFIHDLEGNILNINHRTEKTLGFSKKQILDTQIRELHPESESDIVEKSLARLKSKGAVRFESRLTTKDDKNIDVEISSRIVDEEKGLAQALVRDITDRKQAESQKDEYERILSSTLNALESLVLVIDENRQIVFSNWQDHEWVPEEKRNQRPYCYKVLKNFNKPCENCPPLETFKDGQPRWYEDRNPIDGSFKEISVMPIFNDEGEVKYVLENVRDVTERKKARIELAEEEKKYREIFNNANDAMYLHKLRKDGMPARFCEVNRVASEMLGYGREEFMQMAPEDIDSPETKDKLPDVMQKLSEQKHITFNMEHVTKSGERIPVEISSHLFYLNDEQYVLSIARDISRRKQAQEKLRKSEEKYFNLIQQANDAIYLLYKDRFEVINNRFEEIFGITREEANSPEFDFMELVAPESQPLVKKHMLKTKSGEESNPRYEFTAINKQGKKIEVEATISHIAYKEGVAIQGILRDITERKKMQKQLQQAQKLKSIGTLAGGVAHDFNNILTVIIGLAQLVIKRMDRDDPNINHLKNINESAERAAKLTDQLLLFSRKKDTEFSLVNLNAIISRLNKMLYRLIGEDISMHPDFADDLWRIRADENQIEQVITNLVVNARDAMPEGGQLTICTQNITIGEEKSKITPNINPGEYVLLSVEDTGKGIEKDIKDKIFDPFFTTKNRSQGTGMGLSVVHGIIKKHNGVINVYSEPGQGTIFRIYFPAVKENKTDDIQSSAIESFDKYAEANETILLVEDERELLIYLERLFENYGYNYYSAESGEKAINIFQQEKDNIDILISDVIMTGMDGVELADKLKKKKEGLKVILTSGYPSKKVARTDIKEQGYAFIQKPYDISKLIKLVKKKLQEEK